MFRGRLNGMGTIENFFHGIEWAGAHIAVDHTNGTHHHGCQPANVGT